MIALQAKDTFKEDEHAGSVESAITNLVRSEVGEQRKLAPDPISTLNMEGLTSLITRVSGFSASEIDVLIEELNGVRNFLRSEGKRIQRELSQYAQMNQSAMSSIQMISDAFGNWKSANLDYRQASGALVSARHSTDDPMASPDAHAESAPPTHR